jgi:hypothetical protein
MAGLPPMVNRRLFFIAVGSVAFAALAFAHHSTSMFNMGKPTTLEATVTSFEWTNPHTYLHVNITNAEGKPEEWVIEIHSTAIMLRRGYTKDYFKPGDKITVVGGTMKDGSHMMRLLRGNKADGTKFYGDDFSPGSAGTTGEK